MSVGTIIYLPRRDLDRTEGNIRCTSDAFAGLFPPTRPLPAPDLLDSPAACFGDDVAASEPLGCFRAVCGLPAAVDFRTPPPCFLGGIGVIVRAVSDSRWWRGESGR